MASSPLLCGGLTLVRPRRASGLGGDAGSPWQGLTHSRCSACGKQLRSPHLHTEASRPCRGTQSGFALVEPSVSAAPSSPAVLVRTLVTGPGSPSPAARGKPGVGGESGEDLDCWRRVRERFPYFHKSPRPDLHVCPVCSDCGSLTCLSPGGPGARPLSGTLHAVRRWLMAALAEVGPGT